MEPEHKVHVDGAGNRFAYVSDRFHDEVSEYRFRMVDGFRCRIYELTGMHGTPATVFMDWVGPNTYGSMNCNLFVGFPLNSCVAWECDHANRDKEWVSQENGNQKPLRMYWECDADDEQLELQFDNIRDALQALTAHVHDARVGLESLAWMEGTPKPLCVPLCVPRTRKVYIEPGPEGTMVFLDKYETLIAELSKLQQIFASFDVGREVGKVR